MNLRTRPKRQELLNQLKGKDPFDLLIIGGGATGSGLALDAALRGYRVALVEAHDFAGQTSSRSTKLLHGGVRYLEKALTQWDWKQLSLVKDGLREREILLKSIPRLTRILPILIPVYSFFHAIYYFLGIKIYDFLAGDKLIGASRFVSKSETISFFPHLKKEGLKGGILYYDGQFDDTRLNLSLIFKAIENSAVAVNYIKASRLIINNGNVEGATVIDQHTKECWPVLAKVTINAAGPFADGMRYGVNPSLSALIQGSSGIHLVVDSSCASQKMGLLIPHTSDGRVVFLLPWKNKTLVGTTDTMEEAAFDPLPKSEQVAYLLSCVNHLLEKKLEKKDIQSAWCGIRPLIAEKETSSSELRRGFLIEKGAPGFYSLLGGKWTTFRKMAETLLDQIAQEKALPKKKKCQTRDVPWQGEREEDLEKVKENFVGWDVDIRDHFLCTYGIYGIQLIRWIQEKGLTKRLIEGFPFLEGEIIWAIREEYAQTLKDLLFRRIPLAMIDKEAAEKTCLRVAELMGEELGWEEEQVELETVKFIECLKKI